MLRYVAFSLNEPRCSGSCIVVMRRIFSHNEWRKMEMQHSFCYRISGVKCSSLWSYEYVGIIFCAFLFFGGFESRPWLLYQRQLSLPSLRGRLMSTSESWGVNGHTTRYTSPVSVVLRLRLVSGWGLRKRRSAPLYGPLGLRVGLYLLTLLFLCNILATCGTDVCARVSVCNPVPVGLLQWIPD